MRLREQVLQRREETLWQRFELLITADEGPSPSPSASLLPGQGHFDHSNASTIQNNMSMTTMSMPISPVRNTSVTHVTGDQYGQGTYGSGSVIPVSSLPVPAVGSLFGQNKDY